MQVSRRASESVFSRRQKTWKKKKREESSRGSMIRRDSERGSALLTISREEPPPAALEPREASIIDGVVRKNWEKRKEELCSSFIQQTLFFTDSIAWCEIGSIFRSTIKRSMTLHKICKKTYGNKFQKILHAISVHQLHHHQVNIEKIIVNPMAKIPVEFIQENHK